MSNTCLRPRPVPLDASGFQLGDPVKFKEPPFLGKIVHVGYCYFSVQPVGRGLPQKFMTPDDLTVCRCVRSQFLTPMGQAALEKCK